MASPPMWLMHAGLSMIALVGRSAASLPSYHELLFRNDSPPDPNDNEGPAVLVASWLLTGFAALFLALRVIAKHVQRRALWWDDWLLIMAWLALLVETGLITQCVRLGWGRHVMYTDRQNWLPMSLSGLISAVFGLTAAAWSKTSFAVTLLRLMRYDGPTYYVIWFIIVTINLFLGLQALFSLVRCKPLAAAWDHSIQDAQCLDSKSLVHFGIFGSVWSGVMDILLALLPWKMLRGLQMVRREKVGVGLAMSLGVFAGATAFVKVSYYMSTQAADWTWTVPMLSTWGIAESAVTIVAASIPALRMLVRTVVSTGSHGRGRTGTAAYNDAAASSSAAGATATSKGRIRRSLHPTAVVNAQRLPSYGDSRHQQQDPDATDTESEKSILGNTNGLNSLPHTGRIMRKDEVRVEFSKWDVKTEESGVSGGNEEYELDNLSRPGP
jgi:hypothetical protein